MITDMYKSLTKCDCDCIVLYCIVLYCIASHHIALSCLVLRCFALRCAALRCAALHCTALHCTALHCTALHCTALHCIALHCIALHCIALYCIVLYCKPFWSGLGLPDALTFIAINIFMIFSPKTDLSGDFSTSSRIPPPDGEYVMFSARAQPLQHVRYESVHLSVLLTGNRLANCIICRIIYYVLNRIVPWCTFQRWPRIQSRTKSQKWQKSSHRKASL